MRAKRRTIPGALKAKVAMEALVGDHTINEIASENQVHATQVVQWKKQLKEAAVEFFGDRRRKSDNEQEQLPDALVELRHQFIDTDPLERRPRGRWR